MQSIPSGNGEKLRRLLFKAALIAFMGGTAALVARSGNDAVLKTAFADVGTGGTGAALSGPISGFGSIIMCSQRIDDSRAKIVLDDDNDSATSADLKLGMTIDVEGAGQSGNETGSATTITGRSFVQGPVSEISVAGNRL